MLCESLLLQALAEWAGLPPGAAPGRCASARCAGTTNVEKVMDDAASVRPYAVCMHAFGIRRAILEMVAAATVPAPTRRRRTEWQGVALPRAQTSWSIVGTAIMAVMLCWRSMARRAAGEYVGMKTWQPPAMSTARADEIPPECTGT